MKIFLTADTHFGHRKIEEYCGRPKGFETLIWNGFKNLKKDHILIHLGDICWGNEVKVHEAITLLPCRKILVKGNHDKKTDSWYMNHGWDFVCEKFQIKRGSILILFSHEPKAWDGYFDLNIHGHLHNSQHHLKNKVLGINMHGQYNFCLEKEGYVPISLDRILGKIIKAQLRT